MFKIHLCSIQTAHVFAFKWISVATLTPASVQDFQNKEYAPETVTFMCPADQGLHHRMTEW